MKASVEASTASLEASIASVKVSIASNETQQPVYGETPFGSCTVCYSHVVEKVVSSSGGTVVYNTNISVEAAEASMEVKRYTPWM